VIKRSNFRLYPTKHQEEMLAIQFGCCRWVWNWGLAKRMEVWAKEKRTISRYDLCGILTKLKKEPDTLWLSDAIAQALQSELAILDLAYTKFFKKQNNFPKFKAKKNKQRFRLPQNIAVDFTNRTISIPKIPNIKAIIDREFDGTVKTATFIKVPSGKYFVSIAAECDGAPMSIQPFDESTTIGIDLGLKEFATFSTGEKIANPKFLEKSLRKLAKENHRWSRKKYWSKNKEKQRLKIALVHEKISNQRTDYLHKLSTRIVRENQAIALETLNVIGMARNRRMSRAIWDVGWSFFNKLVDYKAHWYGKTVIRIGQFAPSSRLCTCGIVNRTLTLRERTWTCPACGATHDRDILAANNIKNMALEQIRRGTSESKSVETRRVKTSQRSRKQPAREAIAKTI
jgi:putative transposase